MPNDKPKVRHKIGWCINCGWVHGDDLADKDTWGDMPIKITKVVSDGISKVVPMCKECRAKLEKRVYCQICGETNGDNLYPVTIEKRRFDEDTTCNIIVMLCKVCREKYSLNNVREMIKVPDVCEECPNRFKCWTKVEQTSFISEEFDEHSNMWKTSKNVTRSFIKHLKRSKNGRRNVDRYY